MAFKHLKAISFIRAKAKRFHRLQKKIKILTILSTFHLFAHFHISYLTSVYTGLDQPRLHKVKSQSLENE